MMIVSQLLQAKGNQVWSVAPHSTIYEALQLMAQKNIGAVLVMEGTQIAGIFSERDYARKVVLQGKSSKNTLISEAMTHHVISVRPRQTVEKCMALMTDKRIRHLPVLGEDEKLIGMISIGDIVKAVISEQQVMIDHLTDYISGQR